VKRIEVHFIYTYEDSIMKPTKHCLEKGIMEIYIYSGGGELVQSTLYKCKELSK
jgi:hypothetical protein